MTEQEAVTITPKRNELFIRLLIFVIPAYSLILILDKANLTVILGILAIGLFYLAGRRHVWLLPLLALPSLTLGHVLYIPITTGWIYEARAGEILLLLAAAVYLLDLYFQRSLSQIKVDKLTFFLFSYLVVSVLSVVYVVDIRYFVFGVKITAYSFLAYFLCLNLINSRERLIWFIYSVSATTAILSIQLFFKFHAMNWSSQFILARNLVHIPIGPVATAAAILALLTPLVLGFYFFLTPENKAKPYVYIAFGMGFVGVFLTLGKSAIASLLIALAYLFFKHRKKQTSYILFFTWFVLLAFLFLNPYLFGLIERLSITLVDTSTEFRITEYETAWEIIKYNPVFGVGAGQQLYYFGQLLNLDNPQLVNNYFLQPLINLGVVGLSLAVIIFLSVFYKTKKMVRQAGSRDILAAGFAAAMIVAFFNGLAEVSIFALPYAIIFWGIVGAMSNLKKTDNR